MNVLITGSNGFIGNHLVKRIKKVYDSVYEWNRDGIFFNEKRICDVDVTDPTTINAALTMVLPNTIIHCMGAADVNKSITHPYEDLKSNYMSTHNILFALKETNIRCRFILLSSAAVYGNPVSLPMSETAIINPLSPYALHKRAAEESCLYMHDNYGFDVKILRIFSVYGPGLKKQIFWDMYRKIIENGELVLFGSGNESRDYIYIDDLINAIMLVIGDTTDNTIYNVGNGIEIKINYAAQIFASEMNLEKSKVVFTGANREGDPINWKADISKLKSIGYKMKVPFELGVKKYIRWVKDEQL